MSEQAAVERWLYGKLNAVHSATGSRVYCDVVPEGTPLPVIIFQRQASTDAPAFTSSRIAEFSYVVRVLDQTDSTQGLSPVADAIDAALEQVTGSESGVSIGCVREAPFSLTETVDGVTYRHLGGQYRIRAQA